MRIACFYLEHLKNQWITAREEGTWCVFWEVGFWLKGHELACYCQIPAFCHYQTEMLWVGWRWKQEVRLFTWIWYFNCPWTGESYIVYICIYTLPETKIAHENAWKLKFPFRAGPFFRGGLLVSGEGLTRKLTSQNTLWLAESIFFHRTYKTDAHESWGKHMQQTWNKGSFLKWKSRYLP